MEVATIKVPNPDVSPGSVMDAISQRLGARTGRYLIRQNHMNILREAMENAGFKQTRSRS